MSTIDLSKVLDKAWEDKPLAEILSAPVAALKGVTDKDAELLQQAFGVRTVADFGQLKYARWASALVALNQTVKV
ncbi:hypothetical protein OOK31_06990 [Streptomyces sp. NBC_00249]|uniref:hypothetical protein n=1 Tax=Streptomyces sp. NBC_00249 TaxID=2975690 RepID=UPI00225A2B31|nr:hypothetical protein [Streptomyces sp. NBC_00249]MCX5193639.1 hypothetical protein [Streptomyces sp. NBC_00249]